jgi:hypothetical protein
MKIMHEAELNLGGFVKTMPLDSLPIKLRTSIHIPQHFAQPPEETAQPSILHVEFRLSAITTVEIHDMGLYTEPYIRKTGHYMVYHTVS